jgi:hypothetical protein
MTESEMGDIVARDEPSEDRPWNSEQEYGT